MLIVFEDYTQKYVHKEEDPENDESNEVYSVPCARVISLKHDVREIWSRDEHDQLVKSVTVRVKICIPLERSLQYEEAYRGKVADVEEDAAQDYEGVLEVVDDTFKVLPDRAKEDYADPRATQVVDVGVLVENGRSNDISWAYQHNSNKDPVAQFVPFSQRSPFLLIHSVDT